MKKNWKGLYRLLQRYQDNSINPIKKQVVDFWYDSLGAKDTDNDLLEDEQAKIQMWNSIKLGMHGQAETPEPILTTKWWHSAYVKLAAACIILVAGFIVYKSSVSNKYSIIAKVPDSEIRELLRNTNETNRLKLVKLSDGSEITLDPGATLYFPEVFAVSERKVF
ncbi:hypothetical protein [Dyadobacter frigoris]|uniref:FecR domain-containing protein n=1 Tax=Dyadobacter frigoris TaxID=2576211 RepID=A0A4U6D594_9BACT|nr:hypothetical protein [Dyadobacter frigoris]TKT92472.1 hypothetical protein FDK13_10940 [Dyadobacter frigoris]GLU55262.1 hypothetical protein Dfri01_47230 [Dyadobacter frigoris]